MVEIAIRGARSLEDAQLVGAELVPGVRVLRLEVDAPAGRAAARVPCPARLVRSASVQIGSSESGLNECADVRPVDRADQLPCDPRRRARVEPLVRQPRRGERVDRGRAPTPRCAGTAGRGALRDGPGEERAASEEQRPLDGDEVPVDVDDRVEAQAAIASPSAVADRSPAGGAQRDRGRDRPDRAGNRRARSRSGTAAGRCAAPSSPGGLVRPIRSVSSNVPAPVPRAGLSVNAFHACCHQRQRLLELVEPTRAGASRAGAHRVCELVPAVATHRPAPPARTTSATSAATIRQPARSRLRGRAARRSRATSRSASSDRPRPPRRRQRAPKTSPSCTRVACAGRRRRRPAGEARPLRRPPRRRSRRAPARRSPRARPVEREPGDAGEHREDDPHRASTSGRS